jgi:tRNA threonylcarbamoyladenosine biosynthesis protein TsaB
VKRGCCAKWRWPAASVQLIAVTIGPGSFTGLRIGVTMAKTFAYAVGAEVIGINTLAVLAEQAGASNQPLWTVMDAQRQELFAARWDGAAATDAIDTRIISESDWLAMLAADDRVTGPALRKLQPRLPAGIEVVDASRWQPLASAVGTLAWRDYHAGRRDDLWRLLPQYYRLSAAEEKRGRQGDKETRS